MGAGLGRGQNLFGALQGGLAPQERQAKLTAAIRLAEPVTDRSGGGKGRARGPAAVWHVLAQMEHTVWNA
jgi:hypothetical protein